MEGSRFKRRGSHTEALRQRCGSCWPRSAGSEIPKALKAVHQPERRHRSRSRAAPAPDALL